jgi:signal transduction histidine kinase
MLDTLMTVLLYFFSIAVLVFLLRKINRLANKKLLHNICSVNVLLVLIWTVARFANNMLYEFLGASNVVIFFFGSLAIFFLPSTLVLFSILLIKNRIESIRTYVIVLIPPALSTVLLATTGIHKMFLKQYLPAQNSMIFGPLYYIHCTWMMIFSFFTLAYITYYSLKYTNGFSKQILVVLIGISTPILADLMIYLNYFSALPRTINMNVNVISYCVSAICLTYAIAKYRFLDVVPIAIRSVVDNISDSFILVDFKYNILEVNSVLKNEFGDCINEDANNLFDLLDKKVFEKLTEQIVEQVNRTWTTALAGKFEYKFDRSDTSKFYNVEITPIFIHNNFMATLILFKNVTEHKQVLELIEENTNQLIEKARLLSLNQLIGGIAHNIKSPLMSSSGGMLSLERNTKKIYDFFLGMQLLEQYPEYEDVLRDMQKWEGMIKQYLIYISDVISAVKEQAVSLNSRDDSAFKLREVLDNVSLLLEFELKKSRCKLKKIINIDPETKIEGDRVVLTQIINIIIMNAIQAYSDGGIIELTINEIAETIMFVIKDYGKGIEKEVRDKLFNEMVTTKGKDGTGLGLYIANIALKGQFRGAINVESEIGVGTSVFLMLPKTKNQKNSIGK